MINSERIHDVVSAAIFSPDRREILAVLRPEDDEDALSGMWGLPALRMFLDESEEDAVRRIGPIKLGTETEPVQRFGSKQGDRQYGKIELSVWESTVSGEPDFSRRDTSNPDMTQYERWEWTEPETFIPAAQRGSLCSQILLEYIGIIYDAQS